MKVLVLGATGMAGHMITKYLKLQGYQVQTSVRRPTKSQYDNQIFNEIVDNAKFYLQADDDTSVDLLTGSIDDDVDYVINCIGLLVKDCQDRPDLATKINAWFPQYLAYRLQRHRAQILHISTDCVFDGRKGKYVESDATTEKNNYGRSKSLGEIINNKDLTLRCSIIGPEIKNGTGLMHWFQHQSDNIVQGWTNAYWNGITTLQLAKCLDGYMQDNQKITGLYHLVDNDCCISKCDLLSLINTIYESKKTIVPVSLSQPIDKTIIDTRLCRPWSIPSLETQLKELRLFDPLSHM
jgi:dTDP-4-dehydrorhamnose reductase